MSELNAQHVLQNLTHGYSKKTEVLVVAVAESGSKIQSPSNSSRVKENEVLKCRFEGCI